MWPTQFAFLLILCRIFLSSFALCTTCSFLTRSGQLIWSVLLQHHISKLFRYFWSTFRTVQVSAPHKAVLQMYHFTSFFLNFMSNLLVRIVFLLLNDAFAMAILDSISCAHHLLKHSLLKMQEMSHPFHMIWTHKHDRLQYMPHQRNQ